MNTRVGGYLPSSIDLAKMRQYIVKVDGHIDEHVAEIDTAQALVRRNGAIVEELRRERFDLATTWLRGMLEPVELAIDKIMRRKALWRSQSQWVVMGLWTAPWVVLSFHREPTEADVKAGREHPQGDFQPAPKNYEGWLGWKVVDTSAGPLTDAAREHLSQSGDLHREVIQGGAYMSTFCLGEVFYNPETDEMSAPLAIGRLSAIQYSYHLDPNHCSLPK